MIPTASMHALLRCCGTANNPRLTFQGTHGLKSGDNDQQTGIVLKLSRNSARTNPGAYACLSFAAGKLL